VTQAELDGQLNEAELRRDDRLAGHSFSAAATANKETI